METRDSRRQVRENNGIRDSMRQVRENRESRREIRENSEIRDTRRQMRENADGIRNSMRQMRLTTRDSQDEPRVKSHCAACCTRHENTCSTSQGNQFPISIEKCEIVCNERNRHSNYGFFCIIRFVDGEGCCFQE
ncbi:hypothetical protein LSTR_LSTR016225 [Laodelphax striatellus]|uniref:Uncharacterized protein n=1 Tax=Laodelphax striatellus TaxID=195883 RepID=A0A482XQE6_LAOST|nr:hypothetical protein LSTR_LSTR016225 [Laodelphax striatellus]